MSKFSLFFLRFFSYLVGIFFVFAASFWIGTVLSSFGIPYEIVVFALMIGISAFYAYFSLSQEE